MKYSVHYSKSILDRCNTDNPVIREWMSDLWKFETVEANSEKEAIDKLIGQVGEDKVNYILSVTPLLDLIEEINRG